MQNGVLRGGRGPSLPGLTYVPHRRKEQRTGERREREITDALRMRYQGKKTEGKLVLDTGNQKTHMHEDTKTKKGTTGVSSGGRLRRGERRRIWQTRRILERGQDPDAGGGVADGKGGLHGKGKKNSQKRKKERRTAPGAKGGEPSLHISETQRTKNDR